MLELTIDNPDELWDEEKNEFIPPIYQKICLEHSLISISKWEQKYHRAFLSNKTKITDDELLYYIRCMTTTQNVDPSVYFHLSSENLKSITDYINDPMTASNFFEDMLPKKSSDVPTSDLIYYWMFSFGIPIDCQKWHLNRLLTLIRIFDVKNRGANYSSRDMARNYSMLNKMRRSKLHPKG